MLRSEDDIHLMDDADCFIKRKKTLLRIKDGFLFDPSSSGGPVALDFFQMNKSRKMVHIDYNDVMIELANVRTSCHKRFKPKKRLHSLHESDLLKTIKDLQEKVALVTEQLSHVLLPKRPIPVRRKELSRRSRLSEFEQKTQEKISPIPRIVMEKKDSSKSMFSDSEEQVESIPVQKYNDFKHIHNEKVQSLNSESDTDPDLSNLNISKDSSQLRQIVKGPLKVRHTAVQIDAETLQTIGWWASRNRDFFPYKGMTCVPEGTFENDDEYFLQFLSMLNPTVQISNKLASAIQIDSSIPSNIMNQDEFSKTIGLVRVSNIENHKVNDSYSEIDNSQSRLLRKRISKANEKSKLPKTVSDQRKAKSSLPNLASNNVSNLDKKMSPKKFSTSLKEKIYESNDSTTSDSDFDLVKSNQSEKLQTGLRTIPPKLDVSDERILRDHRSNYTEEEDRIILKWVLKDDNSVKVKGNKIWVQLEKKGIKPGIVRTWQSLRSRFIKTILSQLGMYGLDYNEMMQLRKGAVKGSIKTKLNNLYNPKYASVMSKKTGRNPAAKSPKKPKLSVVTGHTDNRSLEKNTINKSDNVKEATVSGSCLLNNLLTRKLYNNKTFVALSDTSSI